MTRRCRLAPTLPCSDRGDCYSSRGRSSRGRFGRRSATATAAAAAAIVIVASSQLGIVPVRFASAATAASVVGGVGGSGCGAGAGASVSVSVGVVGVAGAKLASAAPLSPSSRVWVRLSPKRSLPSEAMAEMEANAPMRQTKAAAAAAAAAKISTPFLALRIRGGAQPQGDKEQNRQRGGKKEGEKSNEITRKVQAAPIPKQRKQWLPIRRSELPRFASLSSLMFLFIYVFTTVRDTKDTLVVSHCGAESIPLLKLCGVTPAAAFFLIMYGRAAKALDRDALFYVTLVPFFVFYAAFGFVLYPFRDVMHFTSNVVGADIHGNAAAAAAAAANTPMNLLRYWSFSLYFIVSELWASAGVPLLFWQCANDVTPLDQAKRFYPLFAVFGNLAPILSGRVMSYIVSRNSNDDVGFGRTLMALAAIKVGICALIVFLYRVVYAISDRSAREAELERVKEMIKSPKKGDRIEVEITFDRGMKKKKQKQQKATLAESMKELAKSPALQSIATMVLCYNVCVELTEVLWKALLRKTYPSKSSYMSFMASFSQMVGYVALVLQLCASAIIRSVGWRWAAMLTPLAMGLLAMPYFGAVAAGTGRIPLATALLVGTAQNVASKVTKYSLFDPCKEMAYIPLGPDAKVRGKAAVEVLGARLGRSVGSASQQLLVLTAGGGDIVNCAAALGVLYAVTIGFWIRAVSVLAKVFDEASKKGGGGEGGGGGGDATAGSAGSGSDKNLKKREEMA